MKKPTRGEKPKQITQQIKFPSEMKITGTVNTIPEKKPNRNWITTGISLLISVLALIVSTFSLNNANKILQVQAAPKFGLNVSYYQGYYEDSTGEDYFIYHGPAEDETGNRYNYSSDRKVRTVEVYNEGAPLQAVDITVIPYFRIYETSRIYDEEAKCPVGISTDVYYFPIDNREKVYNIYQNGTSQGTLAVIGDTMLSGICVMKIGIDTLEKDPPGGYPRLTCFEEDMYGPIEDTSKEYIDYVQTIQSRYAEYVCEGDHNTDRKKDKWGYYYTSDHLKLVTVANLAYYLKIDYKDYFGNCGQKIYNINTGYEIQYWSYFYSSDLPGGYDVAEDDEVYRRISEKDYTMAYAIDDDLNTLVEEDGIKYTANILEYLLSDHEIQKHVETKYVSGSYNWEW